MADEQTTPAGTNESGPLLRVKQWHKRRKESGKAYQAFQIFYELREGRSVETVARELGKSETLISRWKKKYEWDSRAEAYMQWQQQVRDQQAEILAKAEAEKKAELKRRYREQKLRRAEKIDQQIDLMLGFPLTEVKRVLVLDEDGREKSVQVIKPTRWSKRDVPALAAYSDRVKEEALNDDETEIVEQDHWDQTIPFKADEDDEK